MARFAIRFDVKVRTQPIQRVRAKFEKGDRAAMLEIAQDMAEMARRCFVSERTPWGHPWRKHSATTLALYARGGLFPKHRPSRSRRTGRFVRRGTRGAVGGQRIAPLRPLGVLRLTGKLMRSLTPGATATEATVRVNGDARLRTIARVHQFGNPRNRLPNNSRGRRAPIPARPFLPLRPGGKFDPPQNARARWVAILRRAYLGSP